VVCFLSCIHDTNRPCASSPALLIVQRRALHDVCMHKSRQLVGIARDLLRCSSVTPAVHLPTDLMMIRAPAITLGSLRCPTKPSPSLPVQPHDTNRNITTVCQKQRQHAGMLRAEISVFNRSLRPRSIRSRSFFGVCSRLNAPNISSHATAGGKHD
jgi:hypothetical protein